MTTAALLLALWLAGPPGRPYHPVTIAALATTSWTHVEVRGLVTYVRKQADGDWHLTLDDGEGHTAVAEIIPAIPLVPPRKGQRVVVRGIARMDTKHKWPEVHPVEDWTVAR